MKTRQRFICAFCVQEDPSLAGKRFKIQKFDRNYAGLQPVKVQVADRNCARCHRMIPKGMRCLVYREPTRNRRD